MPTPRIDTVEVELMKLTKDESLSFEDLLGIITKRLLNDARILELEIKQLKNNSKEDFYKAEWEHAKDRIVQLTSAAMAEQSKQLCQRLLNLYYASRPHGQNQATGDKCECLSCVAWDKVEAMPESAFDELKAEIEKEES